MTLRKAILILMQTASNDVTGSGMGYRNTTDAWRKTVAEAWGVAFTYCYKRHPDDGEYRNAEMVVR